MTTTFQSGWRASYRSYYQLILCAKDFRRCYACGKVHPVKVVATPISYLRGLQIPNVRNGKIIILAYAEGGV